MCSHFDARQEFANPVEKFSLADPRLSDGRNTSRRSDFILGIAENREKCFSKVTGHVQLCQPRTLIFFVGFELSDVFLELTGDIPFITGKLFKALWLRIDLRPLS